MIMSFFAVVCANYMFQFLLKTSISHMPSWILNPKINFVENVHKPHAKLDPKS